MGNTNIPFDSLCQAAAAYGLTFQKGNVKRLDGGHINDSFAVVTDKGNYLIQRLNTSVFRNPVAVMDNISKINEYAKRTFGADSVQAGIILSYIMALDGKNYTVLQNGDFYRVCRLYDAVSGNGEDCETVYETGRGFGTFLSIFEKMDCAQLCETIPDFHNTKKRIDDFCKLIEIADGKRFDECHADIEYILAGKKYFSENPLLPLRVTHNDTKGNNILFDRTSGEPVCIIDLDTVMPGYSVNDFGDAARSIVYACIEDEQNPDRIRVDIDRFDALARGYIGAAGGTLTVAERDGLARGALTMAYECGLRFLSDYLENDKYFEISYAEQNLVRARSQAALLRSLTAEYDRLCTIVKRYE